MERSRLINQRLTRLVVPSSQPIFLAFLKRVFTGTGKQICEAALLRKDAGVFWANFHGIPAISADGPAKWCRVAVSDITSVKEAEQTQLRFEALSVANRELKREIVRRQEVEESLRKSEQQQNQLLEQSRQMQEQLRQVSRQILEAQEEERKKISRELHDVVAQTLTGINLRLAHLKKEAALNTKGIERAIARTQQLVEHSVRIVHRFARELRPTVLDDLGLIPALHTFMKGFKTETGIHVGLSVFAAVEQVNEDKRTVLYRVVQEALTNVARHSHASRAEVKIQKLSDAVCMEIQDNGRGFKTQRVLRAKDQKRLGLLGMRERVEMVGGTFTIKSIPGKGTTVHAEIPFGGAAGKPDDGTRQH
jgi:signal transduction histidine kinase